MWWPDFLCVIAGMKYIPNEGNNNSYRYRRLRRTERYRHYEPATSCFLSMATLHLLTSSVAK